MDASVGGDNAGIFSAGDHATNVQASQVTMLGALRPVTEVRPVAGPVGVPAVGLFVGRDAELLHLDEALTTGDVVVQAVHGLGGIGKSSLVARYVQQHGHRFTQVIWIIADTPSNLDAGLANFAIALEPELAGALPNEGLRERAITWLCAHQDWLIVLDSVTDPADVDPLIARAPMGRYILTSRRSTGWHGLAQPLLLNVLAPQAARELVTQTLGPELSHLLDGVDDLCGQLGYLPLALDQAAAYMVQTRVSATYYLRLLREHPAAMLAEAAEGTIPTRTVARIWTLTLDRLSNDPLCGDILRILAWLAPDGIPRSLLSYLAPEPDVLRALGRLATYSMITYDDRAIEIHRLVQAVARTPDPDDPHRRAALIDEARDMAIGLLRTALPDDPHTPETWPVWRELTYHVDAFAEYTAPATDNIDTSYMLNEVARFLGSQGTQTRVVAYLRRALTHHERVLGTDHPLTLNLRNSLAHAYTSTGRTALAVPLYERTLTYRERVLGPVHPSTLRSRSNLARAYSETDDAARAAPLYEQTLADCEQVLGQEHPLTRTVRQGLDDVRLHLAPPPQPGA